MVVLEEPQALASTQAARYAATRPDLIRKEVRGSMSIAPNGCAEPSSEGRLNQKPGHRTRALLFRRLRVRREPVSSAKDGGRPWRSASRRVAAPG